MNRVNIDELGLFDADCVRTAFIAIDTAKLLANFSEGAATALKSFLDDIAPISSGENARFECIRESLNQDEWAFWVANCIERRGGYPTLSILRVPHPDKQFSPAYSGLPWLWGWRIFDGELAGVYSYLLGGMERDLRGSREALRDLEMWLTITISLGPSPSYKFDQKDPIHFATRAMASAGITLFVAAGNEGHLGKSNSLNPWALSKWVVCVGATTEDGSALLPSSSRGSRNSAQLPTIVAPGVRHSDFAVLGHGALMAIESASVSHAEEMTFWPANDGLFAFRKDAGGRVLFCKFPEGRDEWLSIEALAETLRARFPSSVGQIVQGTSLATEYAGAVGRMIGNRLNSMGCLIEQATKPKLVKLMLQRMARRMPQYHPWEAGAGLVTIPIAADYLGRLTTEDVESLSVRAADLWCLDRLAFRESSGSRPP